MKKKLVKYCKILFVWVTSTCFKPLFCFVFWRYASFVHLDIRVNGRRKKTYSLRCPEMVNFRKDEVLINEGVKLTAETRTVSYVTEKQ